jgi:signal transduction histidine kinase
VRVLGWLGVAVLVIAVYVVVVLGGGLLVGRTESPDVVLSVLATAIVAFTIGPARRRAEGLARRLLGLGAESPYDVLASFSDRLFELPEAGDVSSRMAEVLAEGTGAAWAQVWLLVDGRMTLVATHPPGAAEDAPRATLGATPADADGMRSIPVGYGGALLGTLRLQEQSARPLSPVEERLFAGLAAQAGLALHGAQLRTQLATRLEDLAVRAEELRASRGQLVAAQDNARRRLERDIHDGAQQHLVALTINLRLAQNLAARAPERAVELLEEQRVAAEDAIETLSTLSRGIYPRVLDEQGLRAALMAAASTCPLPVDVDVPDAARFAPAVQVAIYFCCVEALQNAVKHARASRIGVRLETAPEGLRLSVTDDGAGVGDESSEGVGLASMRDRIESLGGHLTIESRPGVGTTVVAVMPEVRLPAQRVG